MDSGTERSAFERLAPAGVFTYLEGRATASRETVTRSDVMAQRGPRDPAPVRSLIGLVSCIEYIPDLLHPIFEKILIGIRSRLTASGCDLLICATRFSGGDDNARRSAVEQTIGRGVNAVIAWGLGVDDSEFKPIVDADLPTMFIELDALGRRTGYVTSANVEAMAEVVQHLSAGGRRRIAHISGHTFNRPGPDRILGYRSALDELGLPALPEYLERGDFFQRSGFEAATRLLALPNPPDAIACASDAMAIGAMAAIEAAGLRIPRDIAVTGFDDADFAVTVTPSLTTVRQDPLGMGTAAAEATLRMLADPECSPPVAVIPTELVVRESSGRAAAKS